MSDLLEQATRALRETTSEPQPRSGLTRARVIEGAEKRYAPRRGGLLRWIVALVAALAASTALARVAQYWPEIKRAIAPESSQQSNTAPQKKKRASMPAAVEPGLQPSAAGAAALEAPAVPAVRETTPAPAPVKKRATTAHRPKPAPRLKPAPEPEPMPPPVVAVEPSPTPTTTTAPAPESAELALFRRAQRLHLTRDPRALSAWDDYLRIAGKGALAPEAKYNRALCLIRLGREAEAKRGLTPFAEGEYGSYRRTEAKSLIDAIDRASK
jgi:hypothetical protein